MGSINSWDIASDSWRRFLAKVEEVRYELNCSYHNAWFRGHSDSGSYRLQPTLFRGHPKPSLDVRPIMEKIASCELEISRVRDEKVRLRKLHNKAWKNKEPTEPLQMQLESLNAQWNAVRAERDRYCSERDRRELAVRGEIDAFVEYSFRSGSGGSRTSWQTLAEMQHHGVPTRLLDWTEVLAIALYFSLGRYRKELEAGWASDTRKTGGSNSYRYRRHFFIPDIAEVPSIWILNPFLLSGDATRRKRIWNLTLDPAFDYYNCFFVRREWHFRKPIPMVSPWVSQRIAAQQGLFTVSGYCQKPLEEQSPKIVREVKIEPPAAVYAVRHLTEFCGITHYSLFRDLDSLGSRMREEYLPGGG